MEPLNSSVYRYFRPPVIYLDYTYLQHTTLRPSIYFGSSGVSEPVYFNVSATFSNLNLQETLFTELPFAATLSLPTVAEFEEDAASLNNSRDHEGHIIVMLIVLLIIPLHWSGRCQLIFILIILNHLSLQPLRKCYTRIIHILRYLPCNCQQHW